MNHKDWYQQRYGKTIKKPPLDLNKAEEYKQISEYNQSKKESLEESAKFIFQEHNIPYEVSGNAWLCNVDGHYYYYFPKSGKWRPKGGKKVYYSRGAADFLGKVWTYQNQS